MKSDMKDQILITFYPIAKVAIVIAWIAILVSMYPAYNLYSKYEVYESLSEALFNPTRVGIILFLLASTLLHVYAGKRRKTLLDSISS
ncbi:MAG: hypothetical protein JJU41_11710 [Bacteroidetes bacterium]|nr:hypothetical protein [Bacteroidota bacterium]